MTVERSSADLIADLEARNTRPITYLVLATADAVATVAPPFLARGVVVGLDTELGITRCDPFGDVLEPLESGSAPTLAALVDADLRDGAERVIFMRNRFLLPRLARQVPALLQSCRAVLLPLPPRPTDRLNGEALAALLSPFDLRPTALGQTANGTTHQLFERRTNGPGATKPVAAGLPGVLHSHVRFENGFVSGEVQLDRAAAGPWHVCLMAGEVPVGIAAAVTGNPPDQLRFRVWAAPELLSTMETSVRVVLTRLTDRVDIRRLARPTARRFIPEALLADDEPGDVLRHPFGVLVLARPDDLSLPAILRSLAEQQFQSLTHIRLDGPAGEASDRIGAEAARLGFADVQRHRGEIGPDKLAVQGLWHMTRSCWQVAVVEGSTPLARDGIATLRAGLEYMADRPDLMAVQIGLEMDLLHRGGWAAFSDRLAPLVRQLAFLFSLEETDYRDWAREEGGSDPIGFIWNDALSRLAARNGLRIAATDAARRVDEFTRNHLP